VGGMRARRWRAGSGTSPSFVAAAAHMSDSVRRIQFCEYLLPPTERILMNLCCTSHATHVDGRRLQREAMTVGGRRVRMSLTARFPNRLVETEEGRGGVCV
jgi:hypothetical protein